MKLKLFVLAVSLIASLNAETPSARPTATVDGTSYPIYEFGKEVKPSSVTSPDYPYQAKKEGRGGTVYVGAIITSKGKVKKAYVDKSDAGTDLRTAAVNAVRDWKFPVIKEGAISISYVVIVPIVLEPQLTLQDIIFDPKYPKQTLGPKTLIAPIAGSETIPPGAAEAFKEAKLDESTKLFILPNGATPPKRIKAVPPDFPSELRRPGVSGKTAFLIFIGADGKVVSLYCYKSDEPAFALSAAQAIVQWKFDPAKINGTAVPVLVGQVLEFNATE